VSYARKRAPETEAPHGGCIAVWPPKPGHRPSGREVVVHPSGLLAIAFAHGDVKGNGLSGGNGKLGRTRLKKKRPLSP
jgi:hypothetical protein